MPADGHPDPDRPDGQEAPAPDGQERGIVAERSFALRLPDKAAVRVAFDALPEAADRFVLVAAVDPEVIDAGIRLLDPAMTELGRLEVSGGRAGEKALVLGSFRRRPGGDWDFVLGGKGCTDPKILEMVFGAAGPLSCPAPPAGPR